MTKKGGKSVSSSQESYKKRLSYARENEKLLVENFVALQKVLVGLSGKLDGLTRQISELLKLFEDSAKVIVKNEMENKKENNSEKELLDTMISLLDQNKVIARGLTLIYESMNDVSPQKMVSIRPEKSDDSTEKKKLVKEDKDYSFSRTVKPSSGLYPPKM